MGNIGGQMVQKISNIILTIFSIGIITSMLAGGLSVVGYVIAFVMGGDNAAALCAFTYNTYLPYVIRYASIFTGIGLLGMYLSKQKALTSYNEEIKTENNQTSEK